MGKSSGETPTPNRNQAQAGAYRVTTTMATSSQA